MKRRKFLKYTAPMAAAPLVLSGASAMRPFATQNMLTTLTTCEEVAERVLVLIQLKGGNDGLNTIIPVNQYDMYAALRPDIKISSTDYIELDTTLPLGDQVGLNPGMTAIKAMYDNDMVNVIQGVSYDSQNRSHFKSRDLYWTGGDGMAGNNTLSTGWMGRYLDAHFPGAAGNPTGVMQDPLGIQLGDSKPALGFATDNINETAINLYGQDPGGYFSLVSSVGGEPLTNVPASEYGEELSYIMGIENSVNVYAERITNVFNAGTNSSTTYPDTSLGNQLKTVARMIDGGSQTKIFLASIDGFDTHNDQVTAGATATGKHSNLWQDIAESVQAFTADLGILGLEEKVLTVTFSEFGRKAAQNNNFGTDHGTLSNMLLFGSSVTSGITGTNVNLSNLEGGTQLQGIQNDYRQVFSTLLQDWLGASDDLVSLAFPTATFSKIPIVGQAADPSCYGSVALPISLSVFEARAIDNELVELEWLTSIEINADYFEVERSGNGENFQMIAKVPADGAGTEYDLTDEAPLKGVSYYRLKQVDKSGMFTYSSVREVEIENSTIKKVRLSPNPASITTYVNFTAFEFSAATIKVISMQGMIHQVEPVEIQEGYNKFSIDVQRLPPGIYIVLLEDTNGRPLGQERLLVTR